MKFNFKTLFLAAAAAFVLTGCDEDTELPIYRNPIVYQTFESGEDNETLSTVNTPGWTTFLQAGTKQWTIQRYSDNGYAEFNPYQSGNASNIGWLISPAIALTENNDKTLTFESSQAYTTSADNKLEVFISTDFDGTNVTAATWTPVTFTAPEIAGVNFDFVPSGKISLSAYSGNVYVGFKVTGGTASAVDGSYQIDNVVVY
ncbi:choice-of-anchor J domain-containing protein [Flavobacterium sp. RHBU_3]|uniref:choice-of-anchor J domain-containing protein n=1 Tax=Flavobacterium sp. RHBU_3 TaxID=3391184 RepID=UPI0039855608